MTPVTPVTYCDRCGRPAGDGDHRACRAARRMEPPRYCARCRRRMVVQVTPQGWTAHCAEHGTLAASAEGVERRGRRSAPGGVGGRPPTEGQGR